MEKIFFHNKDIQDPLKSSNLDKFTIIKWLENVCLKESVQLIELQYVFVSDEDLYNMNMQYLNHDTYTDILTFDLSSKEENAIEGEIYISVDRVKDNAVKFNVNFLNELKRVMVHGLLHLIGYNDHSDEEKLLMRAKENVYLG